MEGWQLAFVHLWFLDEDHGSQHSEDQRRANEVINGGQVCDAVVGEKQGAQCADKISQHAHQAVPAGCASALFNRDDIGDQRRERRSRYIIPELHPHERYDEQRERGHIVRAREIDQAQDADHIHHGAEHDPRTAASPVTCNAVTQCPEERCHHHRNERPDQQHGPQGLTLDRIASDQERLLRQCD